MIVLKNALMSLDKIHEILKRNITELTTINPKSQSRNVALIIKGWHEKLLAWLEDKQNQPPGPIDNLALMDEQDKLLTSIQYKIDFEVVEIRMWEFLVKYFKGGPEIIRKFSVPATVGGSCVLTHPISLEMMTFKGPKFKTCAPDWKFADLKKFLCINLQVRSNEYQFFVPNANNPVNEVMTVGEYSKLHGNKIRLCKLNNDRTNSIKSSCANQNTNLFSTLPHKTYTDSTIHAPSTINVRSASCLGVSYPKPVGLINLGNTCFFNATMQCVIRIKPLVEYVLSQDFDVAINTTNPLGSGGSIAQNFKTVLKDMSTISKSAYNPEMFRRALIKKYHTFANYGQHDSQEVVGAILDGLHEDLNKSPGANGKPLPKNAFLSPPELYKYKNQSIIVDLFNGFFCSSIVCPECNGSSSIEEPFMVLSLPVPRRSYKPVALEECLNLFQQEQVLDSNNMWRCPNCNQMVRARNKIFIKKTPQILIIHLKRFYGSGFFATKIESDVRYPDEIDVSLFSKSETGKYSLFGAIFHSGGMMMGHYTAAAIDITSGHWYSFNDSEAREVRPQEAHSPRAYVLFYQKK